MECSLDNVIDSENIHQTCRYNYSATQTWWITAPADTAAGDTPMAPTATPLAVATNCCCHASSHFVPVEVALMVVAALEMPPMAITLLSIDRGFDEAAELPDQIAVTTGVGEI